MINLLPTLILATTLTATPLPQTHKPALYEQSEVIENAIYEHTNHSVDIRIKNAEKDGCYAVEMYQSHDFRYQTEVVICDLNNSNVEEKINETIALLRKSIADADGDADAYFERQIDSVSGISGSDVTDFSNVNGMGIRIGGAPFFIDVWMQQKGLVDGRRIKGFKNGKSQWIRSRIAFSTLSRGEKGSILVAQLSASIWEAHAPGTVTGIAALIRLGYLKLSGAVDRMPDESASYPIRFDFELGGVASNQTIRFRKNIAIYANEAVSMGIRIVEKSTTKFLGTLSADIRVGLLVRNKMYFGGKFIAANAGTDNIVTIGLESGFFVDRAVTVRAGIEYVNDTGDVADPMATESEGWNLSGGALWRF